MRICGIFAAFFMKKRTKLHISNAERNMMTMIAKQFVCDVIAPSYTGGGIVVVAFGEKAALQVKFAQNKHRHDEIEG